MLEKLDTLIAFAVVMLGVSLIITILTQMISTALGLRGSNLLWGIETMLDKLAPAVPGVAAVAAGPDNNPPAVAAVPAVASLAAQLSALPAGKPQTVRALAEAILTHPLVSDSTFSRAGEMKWIGWIVKIAMKMPVIGTLIQRWRYATAIGADELARVLAEKIPALGEAGATLTRVLTTADPEAERRAKLLNQTLAPFKTGAAAAAELGQGYAVQVDKILQQAEDSAQQTVGKMEAWFNSSMDRVSQRFVTQTRIWTFIFAFGLAFGVHMDSWGLFDQISTNAAVREALVGIKDDMLGQAKAILPQAAPPATEVLVSPEILQAALQKLKDSDPGAKSVPDKLDDGLWTVSRVETWLHDKGADQAAVQGGYRRLVISLLATRADDINKKLQKAGVDLIMIPKSYVADPNQWWLYQLFDEAWFYIREMTDFHGQKNFLGILLTALFLSLGAPFWYNALKNLSNLRTVVANKQDQQQSAA